MTILFRKLQKVSPRALLLFTAIVLIAVLNARNMGVYSTTQPDEYDYSMMSRYWTFAESHFPYYLYALVYRLTRLAGDHFLNFAYMLNSLWYAASLPVIYAVCKRTVTSYISAYIAIASVAGAVCVYTAHFCPEPMYFFGFWLFSYCLMKALDRHFTLSELGAIAGSGIALVTLIKTHGLFLLPGIILFFFVACMLGMIRGGLKAFCILALTLALSFVAVRFSLGYAFAGTSGFYLLGSNYTEITNSMSSSTTQIMHVLHLAIPMVASHLMALITMYATPLILTFTLKDDYRTNKEDTCNRVFTISMLLPLILIISLFSAHVSDIEHLSRLHMRIYNFVFPFLLIITATTLSYNEKSLFRPLRAFIAALIISIIIYFIYHLSDYQLSIYDAPELRGLATIRPIIYLLLALHIISILLWVYSTRLAAIFYLVCYLSLFTLAGAVAAHFSAQKALVPTPYHSAGIFTQHQLGDEASSTLLVIAPELSGAYQALFYVDNPMASAAVIGDNNCITSRDIPNSIDWVLLAGTYTTALSYDSVLPINSFRLIHVDLTKPEKPCTPVK